MMQGYMGMDWHVGLIDLLIIGKGVGIGQLSEYDAAKRIGIGTITGKYHQKALALKGLTHNARTEPFIRVMAKAQAFTASVDYANFDACVRELERRNAFRESEEARLIMAADSRLSRP